jgi:hypothetical protein
MTLQEILEQYRVEFKTDGEHHHCTPGFLQVDCPYCSPSSSKWRLGLAKVGQVARCWVCGSHSHIQTLMLLLNEPFPVVSELLKGVPYQHIQKTKPAGKLVLPDGVGPLQLAHRNYLRERRFEVKKLERIWSLQGIGISAGFAWRIFIPIILGRETVSWSTRSISSDAKLRYKNAEPSQEKLSAKTLLYGEDYCQHSVVVVEGFFDVMRIGPGAAATMGVVYSKEQVLRISKFPRRAICFDNEPMAQRRAEELCDLLEPFPGSTYRVQLDAADPGEASDREVDRLRQAFLE